MGFCHAVMHLGAAAHEDPQPKEGHVGVFNLAEDIGEAGTEGPAEGARRHP